MQPAAGMPNVPRLGGGAEVVDAALLAHHARRGRCVAAALQRGRPDWRGTPRATEGLGPRGWHFHQPSLIRKFDLMDDAASPGRAPIAGASTPFSEKTFYL